MQHRSVDLFVLDAVAGVRAAGEAGLAFFSDRQIAALQAPSAPAFADGAYWALVAG